MFNGIRSKAQTLLIRPTIPIQRSFEFDTLDFNLSACTWSGASLLIASLTQSSVPLLQELHFDNLIDRWRILQFIYESCHQVLVVAREDTQMVSGFVAQSVVVVRVEPHTYSGTTTKTIQGLAVPFYVHSIQFTQHG